MNVFKDSLTLSAGVALPALTGNGGPNGVRSGVPGQVYTDDETQLVWVCSNQVDRWFEIGTADDVTVIQTNGGANTPDGVVAKGPTVWYGADLSVWLKSNKTLDSGGWVNIARGAKPPNFLLQNGDPVLPHIIIGGVDYGNVSYELDTTGYDQVNLRSDFTWTFPSTFVDGLNNVPGGASSDCVGGQPRWPAKALFLLRSSTQTAPPYPPLLIDNNIDTQYPEPNIPGWTTIKYWPRQFADTLPTSASDDTKDANPLLSPTGKWYYCLLMPLGPFCVGPGGSARITWNVVSTSIGGSGNNTYLSGVNSTSSSSGQALAKDANGNIYLGGYWSGVMDMGLIVGNLTATSGHQSGFLAKLDNFGLAQWATQFLGAGSVNVTAVCLDASGNVFVGGYFSGTIDFGGGSVTSSYANDMFIVKLNSAGTHVWDKQFGSQGSGQGFDSVTSLAADASGNIVVGGFMQGNNINFGGGIHYNGAGGFDSCLFKLAAADGAHLWSRLFAADTDNQVNGVAVDSNGDVVVCGKLIGSVDLSNNTGQLPYPHTANTLTTSGGSDGYVGKFDTNGNYLWSMKIGAFLNDNCQSCVVDSGRNIWVAGYFTSQVSIGAFQLNSNGTTDLFLAKLNSNGTALFARSFPGAHYQTVGQLNIDSNNNLVLAGTYDVSLNLGGGGKQSSALFQNTSFVAKYDNSGNYLWDVEVGGSGANQANAVVADSLNYVIVTGFYQATAISQGQTITSQSSLNGYLLKLNP